MVLGEVEVKAELLFEARGSRRLAGCRQSQVGEDLADDDHVCDKGDDRQPPLAPGALEDVGLEGPEEQLGPGDGALDGRQSRQRLKQPRVLVLGDGIAARSPAGACFLVEGEVDHLVPAARIGRKAAVVAGEIDVGGGDQRREPV